MAERKAAARRNLVWIGAAVLVAVVFLGIGSRHGAPQNDASRVAYLESVLKCPSCEDLSIGQSTSSVALRLDAIVREDVAAGMSNAAIEQAVLSSFPGSTLLPQGGLGVAAIAIPTAVIALGALAGGLFFYRRRRRAIAPVGGGGDGALDKAKETVSSG